jgi:phosphorylcholine metabolism protein LicD
MRHKLKFCRDIFNKSNVLTVIRQQLSKTNLTNNLKSGLFSEKFSKKKKINFINSFNFLKKNFFLKNSQTVFKFSININKMYKLPLFFIKRFNFSKKIQKTYSQTMTNLF